MNIVQNEWQQGEFECFKDMPTCLFGLCCPLCLFCKNASDLGESPCMYCCIALLCPPLGFCMLRQKAREKFNIEGDSTKDFLCALCCSDCVNCQVQSEIKHRGGLM